MRVVLYSGKGGVGKTTTAAATAVCAAERGLRTLVVSADAAHSLGDVFDQRLGPETTRIRENLDAIEIDARVEMGRYWGRIRDYLVALFRYQGIEEVVAEELALLPGAEEITTLLAVDGYRRRGRYDLVVVDCAPTDTTLRLVTLPEVAHSALRLVLRLQRVVSSVATPLARAVIPIPLPESAVFRDAEHLIYKRLRALQRLIASPQTSVRLVVTPERMVIDEARRLQTDLALFDVPCDAVVMNRLLPDEAAGEEFFRDWHRIQEERRREVAELFAPLRVLDAPLRDDEVTGLELLSIHGRELFGNCAPEEVLSTAPRVRFTRAKGAYLAHLPMGGAALEGLDVAVIDDELVVRVGQRRRAIKLPRRMTGLAVSEAELLEGELVVSFAKAVRGAAPVGS